MALFKNERALNPVAASAERIHQVYKNETEDLSSFPHWKRLVAAHGVQDCELLLRHFLSSEVVNPPRIALVTVGNFGSYLAEARKNPEATQFPVSRRAAELSERINTTEPEIVPPEHVALSLYRYETLCKVCSSRSPDLWYKMPPGYQFIADWFREYASYGRLRDRVFSFKHPAFRKWWHGITRSVGEYDDEKILDSANELLSRNPEPDLR